MAKKTNKKEDNRLLLGSVRMPDVSNPTRDDVFKRRSAVSDDWEPSKELLDAIKSYEKFSPVVYKDGNGIETIGYGITDKKIIAKYRGGKRMSKKEAERLFNRHVDDVIAQMKDSIPNFSEMSNNQKDAMTSYVYNVGIGSVTRKSPKLMEALENKNWKEAAKQMDFGYNDKNNSGLRRRRDEERALFTAYLDMGLEEPTEEELAAAHARMQQNALEDILSSRNELELQNPLRTKFDEAYRVAVERKQPTFTWNGREFATDLKAEGGPTESDIRSRMRELYKEDVDRVLRGEEAVNFRMLNDKPLQNVSPELAFFPRLLTAVGAVQSVEDVKNGNYSDAAIDLILGALPLPIKRLYRNKKEADIFKVNDVGSRYNEKVRDKINTRNTTDKFYNHDDDYYYHIITHDKIKTGKDGELYLEPVPPSHNPNGKGYLWWNQGEFWNMHPASAPSYRDRLIRVKRENLKDKIEKYGDSGGIYDDPIGHSYDLTGPIKIDENVDLITVNPITGNFELNKIVIPKQKPKGRDKKDYQFEDGGYIAFGDEDELNEMISGIRDMVPEKDRNKYDSFIGNILDYIKKKTIFTMDKKPDGGPVAPRDAIQPPTNPTMDFMNLIGESIPYDAGELPGVVITLKMNPDEYKSAMNRAAARRGRGYVYKGQDEARLLMQGIAGAAGAASLAGAGILGRVINTGTDAVDILLNPYDPTSYLAGFDYVKDSFAKANNLTRAKSIAKKSDEVINTEEQGENMIKSDWGPKYNIVQTVKGNDEISEEVRKRFLEEVIPAYKNMTKQDMHVMTNLEKQAYEFMNENPQIPKEVNIISKMSGISPYAVDKAIRVRIGENITKMAEDYMKNPDTFEFNVSDNLGDAVGGAYNRYNDKVYISKDVFEGDKEELINSLVHEFRHKFDLSKLSDDAVAKRNSLDRIDADDFADMIKMAYQPSYLSNAYGQESVREKIATNAQLRDKIHSHYFYKLGISPKEGDFANLVDNMSDDELMNLLENTNAYGRDYVLSAKESYDVETRANAIRYLLKNLPSSLPFGMDVDLIMNNNQEDNQMKEGGQVSPVVAFKLESRELPTVEHIMDVVSEANRESMDPVTDSIAQMGYVPYIRNYFQDGGGNSNGILTDYFKKWNEWVKRPKVTKRKDSMENASELTKIQSYYKREVVPSLKKKMARGGYTDSEIKKLQEIFAPSGETPGADSLDALMGTIQDFRYNIFNATRNDIRSDENVRSVMDMTIRYTPPEDFLTLLRNTNGFGADYARRIDRMPESIEKDDEIYKMRDAMADAVSYAPVGLGAAYYNSATDDEVVKQMGGLAQHWGDRDWGPDEEEKTPEQIKAELDERYKITPDMPEADRLMMLNLRSFQEGGELSNEYKVKYLYDLLLNEAGMSQTQALAVLGNLWGESQWHENASGDTNTSYGIQQWHGERRKKLIEFAKQRSGNEDPTFWDQAHFLVKEYKEGQGFLDDNDPVKLDGYLSYSKNDFQNAESLHDAVVAWNQGFGRPHKKVMRTEDRYKGALKAAEMLGITVDENMPSFYGVNGISEDPIIPAFDSFAATATKPSRAPAATSVAQNTGEDDEDIPTVPGIENMTQEERQKLWFETYGKQMLEDYMAEENRVRQEQEDARRLQYQQQAEAQAARDAEAAEQARRQAIIEQALDEAMLNIPGMARGK